MNAPPGSESELRPKFKLESTVPPVAENPESGGGEKSKFPEGSLDEIDPPPAEDPKFKEELPPGGPALSYALRLSLTLLVRLALILASKSVLDHA